MQRAQFWLVGCRALLEAHQPAQLLVVASDSEAAGGGINRASRSFRQVALGRACYDDTKAGPAIIASTESIDQVDR